MNFFIQFLIELNCNFSSQYQNVRFLTMIQNNSVDVKMYVNIFTSLKISKHIVLREILTF